MKIQQTVFGSRNEAELFTKLHSNWSRHFNLWPCLPFLNVFAVDGDEVAPPEWQVLLKTSIDITLCTRSGNAPLMSIEFDGMGHGFSREGKYIQGHPSKDPHRKLKLDLKLRLAEQVNYPLLVVSYDEKSPIGSGSALTIADGMIGQIVAKKDAFEMFEEWLAENQMEDLDPAFHAEWAEYVCEGVNNAQLVADLTWNPIAKSAVQYEHVARMKLGIPPKRWEFLYDSQAPSVEGNYLDPGYLDRLKAWVDTTKKAVRVGCRVEIETPQGRLSETAWVRNIVGHGVDPMGLAKDIATLILYKRAVEGYGPTEEEALRH